MQIESYGFSQVFRHLEEIQDELHGERGTLYHDIGEIVDDSIIANFASGGRPAWKERTKEYPWPILNKTGAMGGKALENTQNWDHGARVHHLEIKSTEYAKYHQFGTSKMPMRKFVMLVSSEIQAVWDRLSKVIR